MGCACEGEKKLMDTRVLEKAVVATLGFAAFSYGLKTIGFDDGFEISLRNIVKSFVPTLLAELLTAGYVMYR